VLTPLGRATLPDPELHWLPLLRRGHTDQTQLHTALTTHYNHGTTDLDWNALHHGKNQHITTIPTYPFNRQSLAAPPVRGNTAAQERPRSEIPATTAGDATVSHPLFDRHYEHQGEEQ
jgi:acyl transferase domain-containing protein